MRAFFAYCKPELHPDFLIDALVFAHVFHIFLGGEQFFRHVERGILLGFLGNQRVGGEVRIGVQLPLRHVRRHFGTQQVIEEDMRVLRVRRVGRDGQRINAKADALFREHGHQIRVFHLADHHIGREQITGNHLAREQMHIGGIVIQHAHVIAQGEAAFHWRGGCRIVRGVIGITQRFEHGADHHARRPASRGYRPNSSRHKSSKDVMGFGHPRRIVHDHGHAHGIGHGVHVAGIKVLVEIGGIEVSSR